MQIHLMVHKKTVLRWKAMLFTELQWKFQVAILLLYFHYSLNVDTDQLSCLLSLAFVDLHADFDMGENEAYTALSEVQESFEMSNSICYVATEPRNLYATVNTSYGCLSVSGKSSVRS